MIRSIIEKDLEHIYTIWEKHYKEEFEFPDFRDKFLCAFTVTTDSDKIIAIAGLKPILESIIITDKDFSVRDRRYALYQILHASEFMAKKHGYDQIHAFIQDDRYLQQLLRAGFSQTKGKSVVIGV